MTLVSLLLRLILRLARPTGLVFLLVLYVFTSRAQAETNAAASHYVGLKFEYSHALSLDLELNDAPMQLCKIMRTHHVLHIPFQRSAVGYALAPFTCTPQNASGLLPLEALQQLHDAKVLPMSFTPTPRLSLPELITGHLLFGIMVVVSLLAFSILGRETKRRNARKEILGIENDATFNFIDAMCHAAKFSKNSGSEEISHIRSLARDLTGLDYTGKHIATTIKYCSDLSSRKAFEQFGTGMSADQRAMVLQGVLSVLVADNDFTKRERKFVSQMAKGLALSQERVDHVIHKVLDRQLAT